MKIEQVLMDPYPVIAPVPPEVVRPFWSIMIPVYNCARYLRPALSSVLSQIPTTEAVQIEVVDDQSTRDDPAAVVAGCGDGRVVYFRQPANLGPQANFTSCIQRARGEWVHILHGDDLVAPGFYDAFMRAARAHPDIGAAFCRTVNIDADGHTVDVSPRECDASGIHRTLLERLAVHNLIMFPSIAVKRSTYERLGGFHPALFHAADWDMWKRVAVTVPVWYDPEPLAMYRVHGDSDTSHLMRSGANIADARHAIDIARRYLPADARDEWTRRANVHHGLYAVELAEQMIERRAWRAAWAQTREAFRCSVSAPIARGVSGLALRAVVSLLTGGATQRLLMERWRGPRRSV